MALLRFYHRWREFINVGFAVAMLFSILGGLWQGFTFIQQAQANTLAVSDIQIWKAQTTVNLAVMQQEIHDIWRVTVKKK